jgi:DNA-directed RNA polymerase specialized sigma24 family protein
MENQEQVIAQMCSGDSGAFDILFRHYQTSVYRTAYALVGNRETAGEILQVCLLQYGNIEELSIPKKGRFQPGCTELQLTAVKKQ